MQANQAGILDLVRPGGLGDFKILSQGKNAGTPDLWGMERSETASSLINSLPVPLLTAQHLSLSEGWSLGAQTEFETLWPFPESGPLGNGGSPITQ